MNQKSSFKTDLEKERQLSVLLDAYYQKYLKHYNFARVNDMKSQLSGIDLLLTHSTTGKEYSVDEKAQLDYLNENLPTFAFELSYLKNGAQKKGWLFDASKKTDFYALVTAIYSDEPNTFTSCKITFVNRSKLIDCLDKKDINQTCLDSLIKKNNGHQGKLKLDHLNNHTEGYLYFSTRNKSEKPINLILKLDFLLQNGMAKRFV